MKKNRVLKSGLIVGLLITLLVFLGGCIPGGERKEDSTRQ